MNKKLLIFSDDPLYLDGEEYFVKNPLTNLYNELSNHFNIVISGPTSRLDKSKKPKIYTKVSNKITFSSRPFFHSVTGFFKKLPIILIPTLKNISKNIKNSDIIMLRLPSPIGVLVYFYAKFYSKPIFFYIAGDIKQVAKKSGKYKEIKKPFVLLGANIFDWFTRFMARSNLVFVNGKELLNKLERNSSQCINFIPSLIKEENIFFREDTCQNKTIRLIYVGRLTPVKGLSCLLEALKILQKRRINIYLTIVGEGTEKQRLLTEELEVTSFVDFKGYVPFGEELFRLYRESDIFVLPSLSEGLPKVLLEAMAFGLPIVATNVGGIPDVIKHQKTGILVPPKSPEKIAQAIEKIKNNSKFRKKLIKNGYKFIKDHTLEKQVKLMATTIKQYLAKINYDS